MYILPRTSFCVTSLQRLSGRLLVSTNGGEREFGLYSGNAPRIEIEMTRPGIIRLWRIGLRSLVGDYWTSKSPPCLWTKRGDKGGDLFFSFQLDYCQAPKRRRTSTSCAMW